MIALLKSLGVDMRIKIRSVPFSFQPFAFFSFCSDELRRRMDKCHSEQRSHSFSRMNIYIKHENCLQHLIMAANLLKIAKLKPSDPEFDSVYMGDLECGQVLDSSLHLYSFLYFYSLFLS